MFGQKAHLTLDEREVLHDPAQSCGLKLYVPSQAQFLGLRNEMVTLALKCSNFPVPPENVAVPVRVTRLSSTWPNATLLPGFGETSIRSLLTAVGVAALA